MFTLLFSSLRAGLHAWTQYPQRLAEGEALNSTEHHRLLLRFTPHSCDCSRKHIYITLKCKIHTDCVYLTSTISADLYNVALIDF